MKIVYICSFNLEKGYRGKERATRQKAQSLEKKSTSFRLFYPKSKNWIHNFLLCIVLDFKCALYIFRNKPEILISRGSIGYLSIITAKTTGTISAREIHGISNEENSLLPFSKFQRALIKVYFKLFSPLKHLADIRIFNHPFLYEYYKTRNWLKEYDFVCYNGYSPQETKNHARSEVIKKYSLNKNTTYLVFSGSVSKWHGIEYLISLQELFNVNKDNIQIIIAGGNSKPYDPKGLCINFTPLDDKGCSELVSIAALCLLPVKNNRTSPGSPLKLYDYIGHEKYIVAEDILGYSDEVLKYKIGIATPFHDTKRTRENILNYLNRLKQQDFENYPSLPVTWDHRITSWLENISKVLNKT